MGGPNHAKPWRVGPLKLGTIAIRRDVVSHPLLGDAHVIEHEGRAITAMSALDWERPTRIPVVAAPAQLPPGAGGLLLNHIAELAQRSGVPRLRYAGPYPTPALYRALARSFRASAGEATFTHDVLGRALRLARDEVPVDFVPAPHLRVALPRGHAEVRPGAVDGGDLRPAGSTSEWRCGSVDGGDLRPAGRTSEWRCGSVDGGDLRPAGSTSEWRRGSVDGGDLRPAGSTSEWRCGVIERVVLDGTSYGDARGPGMLVATERGVAAELHFAGVTYARIAELDARGVLLDGPRSIPPVQDPIVGKTFPRELRVAIGELLDVPEVLVADAQRTLGERDLAWADLGGRLAQRTSDGFAVHAALWQLGAPAGRARLVLALAEALAPVVVAAVLDDVQAVLARSM
jgi:hypothetical protein